MGLHQERVSNWKKEIVQGLWGILQGESEENCLDGFRLLERRNLLQQF
jgi:hypothetical protein